jgi:hypothetical protein
MTSLTDQFLNKLRGEVPPKSEPAETTNEIEMSTFSKKSLDWAEIIGAILGGVIASAVSIFLGALVIHWILGVTGIGSLTYWQVVGLLAIWETVKPRSDSK